MHQGLPWGYLAPGPEVYAAPGAVVEYISPTPAGYTQHGHQAWSHSVPDPAATGEDRAVFFSLRP